ncbi:MAG: phosphoenolpyruvate--protein phosphotransferase [Pseudomonadota bacterium]|jgi:phosphoenolpyruvate-protein kinase (PTS system EI component)
MGDDGSSLRGFPSAPGVATGPAHVLVRRAVVGGRRRVPVAERPAERARLLAAIEAVEAGMAQTSDALGDAEADGIARALLASQRAVLRDPQLLEPTLRAIDEGGLGAERALERSLRALEQRFGQLGSAAFRELWRDVEGIGAALLAQLREGEQRLLGVDPGDVLVARTVTVRDVIDLVTAGAAGLVLEEGSLTSHIAVLCRSAGLPAVTGVEGAVARIRDETPLRVDGEGGVVELLPAGTLPERAAPATPPSIDSEAHDGLLLRANLDLDLDAERARAWGAAGVGLWRTFYLYLGRPDLPSEDELTTTFRSVLAGFAPDPVAVRLLDLSGPFAEHELPIALRGLPDCRGVRLLRHRPDVLRTQLRALVRAAPAGTLRILAPFVSDVDELAAIRALADEVAAELGAERPALGAMIEVPAALLALDALAAHSDFFAIGSNDLGALLLARSRDAPGAGHALPAALRAAIAMVVQAGERHAIPVSLCGEIASDPALTADLLGLGLRELSMTARLLPAVHAAARAVQS